jgi:hypothetical protein
MGWWTVHWSDMVSNRPRAIIVRWSVVSPTGPPSRWLMTDRLTSGHPFVPR